MAKFLATSGVNWQLDELIKNARERIVLISPFLSVSDHIKELLIDKNLMKIDIRMVYGKSELHPKEIEWMKGLDFLRTSYCQNLHAKCYMNEDTAIITSMNLYQFSQQNNNEMGILISRNEDEDIYKDIWDEANRIIRSSEEVKLSAEKVIFSSEKESPGEEETETKLTTSKLGQKLKLKVADMERILCDQGFLETKNGKYVLTDLGKSIGGESSYSKFKKDNYFLWPSDLVLK